MQRAGLVLGFFVVFCGAIYLIASPSNEEPKKDEPDPALVKLESAMAKAQKAERALKDNNFGEAREELASLQEQLKELVFLLAEKN
jgi:hypothetical protein